jgi:hypothetical protein
VTATTTAVPPRSAKSQKPQRGATADTEGTDAPRAATITRREAVDDLVKKVRNEQKKIRDHEGGVVLNLVNIGALLIRLQDAAEESWIKTARDLGYHPRTASRLQKLGASWWAEIGTEGSDLLRRLPPDAQKLEWLCRLSRDQLLALPKRAKSKEANRKEVIDAVKDVLGELTVDPRPIRRNLVKDAERFVFRLQAALAGNGGVVPDREVLERLRAVLADGVAQIEAALVDKGDVGHKDSQPSD